MSQEDLGANIFTSIEIFIPGENIYTPVDIYQTGGNISTLVEIFTPWLKYFNLGGK